MNYWERLIDVYESWDFDSLCDEAYELSCAVRDDIRRNCNIKDPLYAAIMVGAYFMDADGFADGAEVSTPGKQGNIHRALYQEGTQP